MAPASPRAHVLLCANDLWNILNFRLRLIERLEAEGYRVSVAAPQDAALRQRLARPGRAILDLPMRKDGLSPWEESLTLGRLLRLLRRQRPDVLLSFTPKPNIYGALAARATGIPAVPNVSGLGTAFIRAGALQRLVTFLYRAAFRRLPKIFFQNEEDLELFAERRLVRRGQAALLPGSGVDLDRFRPLPTRPRDGLLKFLFVGRMLGDKGIRELVEAARMVRDVIPHARIQLLGFTDAENRTAISRGELQAWVSEGVIEYLGSAEDVRDFIAAADAVVLPSYREGLPRSLLEAGAMGKPLIATDVPGSRVLVEDGVNGLLCEARSASSLAITLKRFAALSDEERRGMGERAREKVVQGFSEEKVIRAYVDVLEHLTSPKAH